MGYDMGMVVGSKRRARDFATPIPPELLQTIHTGSLRTRYRGIPFVKGPFEIVLYLQLLHRLRPATVIEIGSYHGGSALWFADMLVAHGIDGRVISVDIEPPSQVEDARITFLQGDANDLAQALSEDFLSGLKRPWLVIEDSAHYYEPCLAVLRFFHRYLKSGDYLVMEDGIASQLPDDIYRIFADGPNRAIGEFLAEHGGSYSVDTKLCDFFGKNVTFNPNGWLTRR